MSKSSKFNHFWVQVEVPGGLPLIVPHGKDEETGEDYFEFLSRAKANKHLKEQKKANPDKRYRVVREVKQMFATDWE